MKKLSQNEKVKKHLEKYKSITTFQAFLKYKVTRLNARIWDLRNSGMEIKSERIQKKDVHYFKYFI